MSPPQSPISIRRRSSIKTAIKSDIPVGHDDKIAFVGSYGIAATTLFQILAGEMEPDEGDYKWGITTSQAYFPKDNTKDFDSTDTIVD